MPREDRVDDLRHDGVVEADDAGEEHALRTQPLHQVFANLVLHAPPALASGRHVVAELSERCCTGRGGHSRILHRQALLRLGRWPSFLRPGCPGPSRLRTAAARRSGPRTPSRRSTTACRSARTVSSSTSTCRATASSSSTTTPRWNAPRARAVRCRRSAPVNSTASTPVTGSRRCPRIISSYPFRGRGLGIPRLGAVLQRYRDARLIIELKAPSTELARRTIDEVRAASAIDRVVLGSFYWQPLNAARRYEPRIPTGAAREETRWALYRSRLRWPLGRPSYREFQVPIRAGSTDDRHAAFHRACAQGRVARARVDSRRSRGDRAAARLGGRQRDQRSAGCGRGRRAEMDCTAGVNNPRAPS